MFDRWLTPSSQVDPYTLSNDHQIFYASYKPSQQTKPLLDLIYLVYHSFDNSNLKSVFVLTFIACIM